MTHPYHEDYVVLPTMPTIRLDNKNVVRDIEYRQIYEDTPASRWSPSSWVNLHLEKHAWLSAGLVWMHGASDSGTKGVYEDSGHKGLESRPTVRLFEVWEKGSHLIKLVVGRNYRFPKSVVPCAWTHSPKSLSLRDVSAKLFTPRLNGETKDQPIHIPPKPACHFPRAVCYVHRVPF